jgi:hypothetical protein
MDAMAAREHDLMRRDQLLNLAVDCTEKNIRYCKRYRVGHNSVLNRIQLARLLATVGRSQDAVREADSAYNEATAIKNAREAEDAHFLRLKLRIVDGSSRDAAVLQAEYLKSRTDPFERARLISHYRRLRSETLRRNGAVSPPTRPTTP